jgi:hypothetical protein
MKMLVSATVIQILIATTSSANAQTRIGSWKFEEAYLSRTPDIYFITASVGDPKGESYSSADFYCDKGSYTFHFLPPANPQTGRNDLPDGLWEVRIFINNDFGGGFLAKSEMGVITASVKKEIMERLAARSATITGCRRHDRPGQKDRWRRNTWRIVQFPRDTLPHRDEYSGGSMPADEFATEPARGGPQRSPPTSTFRT